MKDEHLTWCPLLKVQRSGPEVHGRPKRTRQARRLNQEKDEKEKEMWKKKSDCNLHPCLNGANLRCGVRSERLLVVYLFIAARNSGG